MAQNFETEGPGEDRPARGRALGLRLSLTHRYLLFGISIGVWLTGAVWLIYHHFMQLETEFGFQKHPVEVISLEAHGAFSFAALWIFGTLWWTHVLRGWTSHWRRWSGGFMVAVVAILILTGWGLYYFVERAWREWTSLIHWTLGLAALVIFFVHWLSKSLPRRN
ncbi:MAG: hypothetical protein AB7E79_07130 [Rhodospirillaceae bacterium]